MAIVVAGCTENNFDQPFETLQHMTFSASLLGDPESKAAIDGLDIKWSEGDAIGIFDGTAVSNGVDPKLIIMTAVAEDGTRSLAFKNVVSYIKMTPQFACNKIVLETGLASGICGDIVVSPSAQSVTSQITDGTAYGSVLIEGPLKDEPLKAGETYYMATVPCTATNGFTAIFDSAEDDLQYVRKTNKSVELARSHVLNLGSFDTEATSWSEKAVTLCGHEVDSGWNSGFSIYDWRDLSRFASLVETAGWFKPGYASAYIMNDIDFGGRTLDPLEICNAVHVIIYGGGKKIQLRPGVQGCRRSPLCRPYLY